VPKSGAVPATHVDDEPNIRKVISFRDCGVSIIRKISHHIVEDTCLFRVASKICKAICAPSHLVRYFPFERTI
jgi:hypothetical protein